MRQSPPPFFWSPFYLDMTTPIRQTKKPRIVVEVLGLCDLFVEPTYKLGRSQVFESLYSGDRFGANLQVGSFGRSYVFESLYWGDRCLEPTHKLGRSVVRRFSNPCIWATAFWSQPTSWVVRSFKSFSNPLFGRKFRVAQFLHKHQGPDDRWPTLSNKRTDSFFGDRTMAQSGPWLTIIWTKSSTLGTTKILIFWCRKTGEIFVLFWFCFLLNYIRFAFIWTKSSTLGKLRHLDFDAAGQITFTFSVDVLLVSFDLLLVCFHSDQVIHIGNTQELSFWCRGTDFILLTIVSLFSFDFIFICFHLDQSIHIWRNNNLLRTWIANIALPFWSYHSCAMNSRSW